MGSLRGNRQHVRQREGCVSGKTTHVYMYFKKEIRGGSCARGVLSVKYWMSRALGGRSVKDLVRRAWSGGTRNMREWLKSEDPKRR